VLRYSAAGAETTLGTSSATTVAVPGGAGGYTLYEISITVASGSLSIGDRIGMRVDANTVPPYSDGVLYVKGYDYLITGRYTTLAFTPDSHYAEVTVDRTVTYNVSGTVSKDVTVRYNVLTMVNKDIGATYHVLENVNKDIELLFDVDSTLGTVDKDIETLFNVIGIVNKDIEILFDTEENIMKSVVNLEIVFKKNTTLDLAFRKYSTIRLEQGEAT
jgi:hypothetical protein